MGTMTIVYFGGITGVYLDGNLSTWDKEDGKLFDKCRHLFLRNISTVEEYGVSEESEFWDHNSGKEGWIPPMSLGSVTPYAEKANEMNYSEPHFKITKKVFPAI